MTSLDSAFSALHDLSMLASTLSPSPVPHAAPRLAQPIPMLATSTTHPSRSSHTPPSEASYASTPSLSFSASHNSHSLSPYAPSLPANYGTAGTTPSLTVPIAAATHRKHRRQSSSNGHKRRLSDARDALSMSRPFLTAGADSPPLPPTTTTAISQSVPAASYMSTRRSSVYKRESSAKPSSGDSSDGKEPKEPKEKDGKRIYVCDDCQKVYRHRSCMDKHRWEHSPHWLPSSKFLLSKHQQVQLLEAAAILSHISIAGNPARSLPDDRSQWPKYLAEVTNATGGLIGAAGGKAGKPAKSKWTTVSGRKSVSVYDGESMLGEIDMDDDEVDVVSVDDRGSAMGVDEEDEETEDEIEVVRPWEGVGGLEMEL